MPVERDKEETKVIFKMARYPDGGKEVLAFFPGAPANKGNVLCYAHDGQHAEASYDFYLCSCKQCGEDSYAPLKRELEQVVGYRLKIVHRITRKDLDQAWNRNG